MEISIPKTKAKHIHKKCRVSSTVESEIKALNPKKGKPHMSIPPKQLKDVKDIVSEALLEIWNKEIIGNRKFPSKLKWAGHQSSRNWKQWKRVITDLLVCFQWCQRFLRELWISKLVNIWKNICQSTYVGIGKVIAVSTHC